ALALGRPVVSTFVAGIPELVQPGINGWLVPAGNAAALADALQAALAAPTATLTAMGRAGAAHVAARHDARHEAACLAEHVTRAIAAASPAPVSGSHRSLPYRIDELAWSTVCEETR